jgi:magnesium transporter
MTSDFLAFEEDVTVDQVVKELQRDEGDQRISFYAYVINKTGHLVGVVSLKQLLLSVKATRLSDLMTANVIAVKTNTDQEHVASTVALYDFLSVPVVDESNKLVGVITVDDVIDVIKQEAEEDLLAMGQAGWGLDMSWSEHLLARLPWLFLSFLVGAASYALIYFWGPRGEAWSFLAILPLVLSLGAMAGNQTATVLVGALRTGKFWGGKFYFHMLRELGMSLLLAFIFSGIVLALGHWLLPDDEWKNVFASAVAIQIIAAMLFGAWLPVLFNKLKLDPAIMTPPTYAALADFSAIIILLGLYHVG